MKRYFQKRWIRVLVLTLVALTCTWAVGAALDRYEVAKMTERMETVCVGRLLIDLPEGAKHRTYGAWIEGFNVEVRSESPEEFSARVTAREAQIRAKPDRFGGNKNLESVRDVKSDSDLAGKIFVHGRSVSEGDAYNATGEEHYRYENVALEAHVHGHGISIDLSAESYDPDLVGNLPKLVAKLVPNPQNRIPTEPGFCLDRAYVSDPLTADQGERIMMTAGLPNRPDIEIKFSTTAGTKPDGKGLLARNAASHARLPAVLSMRFTNLRAAPRTIGTLTGDELVERVVEENFAIIYGFEWDVPGTEDNVYVPAVKLRMATGRGEREPISSSLSQPAAIALWDKISTSVRLRPTEPKKVSVAEQVTHLGAEAAAGDLCPHDGWWVCGTGGNGVRVHGGQRQYIAKGQLMPQALLLPPQTLWERVRGLQPSYEDTARTPWKLVDRRSRRRVKPDVPLAEAGSVGPVAAAAVSTDALDRASVGTYAITGNPCPASGWWNCQESDALDGTRWFAEGSLLPAATFAIAPRSFGRRADSPTAVQRRSTWQLVKIADACAEPGSEHVENGARRDEVGTGSSSKRSSI